MARGLFYLLWLLLSICSAQVVITSTIVATSTICPCTSQATTQSSSSASSILTTVSSTSSSFTATTSGATISATTPFPVRIDTSLPRRKRAFFYVAFDDDTAIGVNTLERAALFTIINGYLLNDGMFVGSNTSTGYQTMRRYNSPQTMVQGWSLAENRTISLIGQNSTSDDASASFCVASQGEIVLEFTQTAPACAEADLAALLSKHPISQWTVTY